MKKNEKQGTRDGRGEEPDAVVGIGRREERK